MKAVVAIDSFKGSLSTVEAGEADESYIAQEWKINDQKAVIAVRVAK